MKKDPTFALTRRDFVAAGSALAVAGGLGRSALADCAGVAHRRTARLSVAYLQGSDGWDHLRGLTPTPAVPGEDAPVDEAPLVAADALSHGDPAFALRGARLTIHGLVGDPDRRLPAMLLKAHYQPYHDTAHTVWGFEGTDLCCARPATSFVQPVAVGAGLRLSLEMWPRGADATQTDPAVAEAVFDLGVLPGTAKLRRGAYLMSWALPDGPAPRAMTRLRAVAERIDPPEEGMAAVRRLAITDAAGAARSLSAVLFTVEYGDADIA